MKLAVHDPIVNPTPVRCLCYAYAAGIILQEPYSANAPAATNTTPQTYAACARA